MSADLQAVPPPVEGAHTLLVLDATEFARFLEHMAGVAELAAVQDETPGYSRAYLDGCAHTYRHTLATVARMVEGPADSPFVVQPEGE